MTTASLPPPASGKNVFRNPAKKVGKALGFVIVWLVGIIEYLYLARVPLAGLVLLLGLPFMATGPGRTLVIGAYDMGTFLDAFLVGLAVCAVAASTLITAGIVSGLGNHRYGLKLGSYAATVEKIWLTAVVLAIFYNIGTAVRVSDSSKWENVLGGMLAAIALAMVVRQGLIYIQNKLMTGYLRATLLTVMKMAGMNSQPGYLTVNAQGQHDIAPGHASALAFAVILAVLYCVLVHTNIPALVTVMMVIGMCVLYLAGLAFFLDRYRVPLLLGILAYCAVMSNWWQNDHYYRLWPLASQLPAPLTGTEPATEPAVQATAVPFAKPASRAATASTAVTALSPMNVSPMAVAPSEATPPHELSPRAVILAAMKAKRPIVVVASAGGGIQATAWTTATLERVGEELRIANPTIDFPSSVRLISGVSGGSVGGLFYAMAADRPGEDRFRQADVAAENSGLGRAMLGLLRDDVVRAVAPFVILNGRKLLFTDMDVYSDRGHELEMAWVQNAEAQFPNGSGLGQATLSQWGADALELRRPALVFNSTLVETGERFAISTIPTQSSKVGSCEFLHRYKADLLMTTAARLSATFPIISPTARPAPAKDAEKSGYSLPGPEFWPLFPRGGNYLHAVDGGYYENSGVVGAVEWLNDGFEEMRKRGEPLPEKVLFIELNAFPEPQAVDETKAPSPNERAIDAGDSSHGTLYDLVSPLPAMMNVRDSGQRAFAGLVFRLFCKRWYLEKERHTEIVPVSFYYDFDKSKGVKPKEPGGISIGPDPYQQPLSWHLRPCEKADITDHLDNLGNTPQFQAIRSFFESK